MIFQHLNTILKTINDCYGCDKNMLTMVTAGAPAAPVGDSCEQLAIWAVDMNNTIPKNSCGIVMRKSAIIRYTRCCMGDIIGDSQCFYNAFDDLKCCINSNQGLILSSINATSCTQHLLDGVSFSSEPFGGCMSVDFRISWD